MIIAPVFQTSFIFNAHFIEECAWCLLVPHGLVSLWDTRNNILKQVWLSSSTTSTLQELLMIAQETRDRLMVVDEPLMTERSLPIEHLPLVLGLDAWVFFPPLHTFIPHLAVTRRPIEASDRCLYEIASNKRSDSLGNRLIIFKEKKYQPDSISFSFVIKHLLWKLTDEIPKEREANQLFIRKQEIKKEKNSKKRLISLVAYLFFLFGTLMTG